MKRAYAPAILASIVLLGVLVPALLRSGSSEKPVLAAAPSTTSAMAAAPARVEPEGPPLVVAPDLAPDPAAVAETVTPEGPPVPPVRWRQRAPGLPLTSDDPAAQGHKVVMLTFDDGPGAGTAKILDVLAQNHVRAMFFITGNALKYPDLVEREHREGHVLGVHTMSHPNLTKLTPAQMRPEIDPLVSLITKVSGASPKYLRPPYGAYNKDVAAVVEEYHMEIINWNNGSLDWDGLNADGWKEPKLVVDAVMRQLGRGSIILMHDTKKHTAEALPDLIKRVREAGYEFVTLD